MCDLGMEQGWMPGLAKSPTMSYDPHCKLLSVESLEQNLCLSGSKEMHSAAPGAVFQSRLAIRLPLTLKASCEHRMKAGGMEG